MTSIPHPHNPERKSSRKPKSAKGSRSRSKKRKKQDKVESIWNSLMMTNSRSIASLAKKPMVNTTTANTSYNYLKRNPSHKAKPYKPMATALLIPNTSHVVGRKKRSYSKRKHERSHLKKEKTDVKLIDVRKIKHVKKDTPKTKPPRPQSAAILSPPRSSSSLVEPVSSYPTQDSQLLDASLPDVIAKFSSSTQKGYIPGKPDKQNQDAAFHHKNFGNIRNNWFFTVCDGHGQNGHFASDHAR